MNDINYRQQWADGEIEAGTLLDAIDELRRDAARYRWLRDNSENWYIGPDYTTYNDLVVSGEYKNHCGGDLDAAIDAAIVQETRNDHPR